MSDAAHPIVVAVDCPAVEERELRRLLEVEVVSRRARAPTTTVQIRVTCATADAAHIQTTGSPTIERDVRLGNIGRERLLTLAIIELVDLVDDAAEPVPGEPLPVPREPDGAATPVTQPPPAPKVWRFEAEAMLHAWSSGDHLSAGARAGVARVVAPGLGGRPLALVMGGRFESGRVDVPLGSVITRAGAIELGAEQRFALGSFITSVGTHTDLGLAWLTGRPADPAAARGSEVKGGWLGLTFDPAVSYPLSGPVRVVLRGEVGYVAWSVRGRIDGSRGPGWEGGWAGGSLGLSWEP